MMEDTEFQKAVSAFSAHLNTRILIRSDSTIEPSEPSFDVSGINDYIKMLIAREQDSAERAFKQGQSHGYHEAMREVKPPLYGDFAFTNGTQKFMVMVRDHDIQVSELKDGNFHVMQEIPKSKLYE